MIEAELKGNLERLLSAFTPHTDIIETGVATRATGNRLFFHKIRQGDGFTVRTYDRCVQWFADNWPADADWPEGVKRPASEEKEA